MYDRVKKMVITNMRLTYFYGWMFIVAVGVASVASATVATRLGSVSS